MALTEKLTSIAANAFKGSANVVATVKKDSFAHEWCVENTVQVKVVE